MLKAYEGTHFVPIDSNELHFPCSAYDVRLARAARTEASMRLRRTRICSRRRLYCAKTEIGRPSHRPRRRLSIYTHFQTRTRQGHGFHRCIIQRRLLTPFDARRNGIEIPCLGSLHNCNEWNGSPRGIRRSHHGSRRLQPMTL